MKGGTKKKKSCGGSSGSEPDHPPLDGTAVTAASESEHRRREEVFGEDGDDDEETEEDRGKGFDQFENLQIQEVGADNDRPKLAEGYYEIEAVRRKRVRKGENQYLIKWRGWPETANTWEPLENLQSCSDVIDAFEESLQTGKHKSTRGRKRKTGVPHTQPKKQRTQQRRTPSAGTYNVPAVKVRSIDGTVSFAPRNGLTTAKEAVKSVEVVNNVETGKQTTENGLTMVSTHNAERNKENELVLKLSELKGICFTNEANGDKFVVQGQQFGTSEGYGSANDLLRVESSEPVQASRCMGAKKRKSGFVKRFKKDPAPYMANETQRESARLYDAHFGRAGRNGIQNPNLVQNDLCVQKKFDYSIDMCTITKIIRPISYSPSESENTHEVSVTFMAMRSDGKEVMVDNKFLKANNPLLLINYYEQHLRYSTT